MGIVIMKVTKAMIDVILYKTAHSFSFHHLCAQLNLILAMDEAKCPKDATKWAVLGRC
jgi:hypothetical protein